MATLTALRSTGAAPGRAVPEACAPAPCDCCAKSAWVIATWTQEGRPLNLGINCSWCTPELARRILQASRNKVRSARARGTAFR